MKCSPSPIPSRCPGTWSTPKTRKRARLNVIRHLLTIIPYKDLTPEPLKLPPILKSKYVRPPIREQNFIPEVYA